jgi:hypothetical protein
MSCRKVKLTAQNRQRVARPEFIGTPRDGRAGGSSHGQPDLLATRHHLQRILGQDRP